MNGIGRRCLSTVILLAAGLLAGCNNHNLPTGTIEKKYYAQGPWAVTFKQGLYCCDSQNHSFDFYYPTNLGASGFLHPIITWGNGSFGQASGADYFVSRREKGSCD